MTRQVVIRFRAKCSGKQFRRRGKWEKSANPGHPSAKVNGRYKVHIAGQMPGSVAALCSGIA